MTKRFTESQIIQVLHEAEREGVVIRDVCCKHNRTEPPCFGYRRIALQARANLGRVLRLWKENGLSLPRKRPRRLCTGERMRLPGGEAPNAVWCYDFVHDRLADGRILKLLCVVDEYTRECLAIEVGKIHPTR